MWKLPINVKGGRKHLLPRSGCGQKEKFGGCYSGQFQAEVRCQRSKHQLSNLQFALSTELIIPNYPVKLR